MERYIFRNFFNFSFLFGLLFVSLCGEEINEKEKSNLIQEVKAKYSDIKIGIYSGTFDPPTLAHNAVIRSALENLSLERLYIFVNKNGEKNYKCSSKERVEMLKRMLKDIEDKVIIVAQASDNKREDYQMIKNILIKEKVVHVVGENSYERRLLILPENRIQFDAISVIPRNGQLAKKISNFEPNAFYLPLANENVHGVSSTKVRSQLAARNYKDIPLAIEVLSYILENNLYIKNNNEIHREQFFRDYYAYIGYLFSIGEVTYPRSLPEYDPHASKESWPEMFYKWIRISPQHKK